MIVRANVIFPVVNVGRQGLREIKVLWVRREPKEIWDVQDRKATGGIRVLWVRREFPVFPEQEAPGETQGL